MMALQKNLMNKPASMRKIGQAYTQGEKWLLDEPLLREKLINVTELQLMLVGQVLMQGFGVSEIFNWTIASIPCGEFMHFSSPEILATNMLVYYLFFFPEKTVLHFL